MVSPRPNCTHQSTDQDGDLFTVRSAQGNTVMSHYKAPHPDETPLNDILPELSPRSRRLQCDGEKHQGEHQTQVEHSADPTRDLQRFNNDPLRMVGSYPETIYRGPSSRIEKCTTTTLEHVEYERSPTNHKIRRHTPFPKRE